MTAVSQIVRTMVSDLANAAVASYTSIPGSPLPIPSLVIPPSGVAPVVDCPDLLIVNLTSITSAFQGPPEFCGIVMQANLAVTVSRCIPNLQDNGTPESRTVLSESGLSLADDVSTLFYGVTAACRAGLLWSGFLDLDCKSTRFREFRPGASGGIGWWTWNVSVDLTSPLAGGTDAITWADTGDEILWES